MNSAYWLNTAWMWKCHAELRRFQRATHAVAQAQAQVLRQIVLQNRNSEFGRTHDFAEIRAPGDFQQRVSLATYDDFRPAIGRLANDCRGNPCGCPNQADRGFLTEQEVLLLEPTSGSSGGEKLIPYTAPLRAEFQCGIDAWIADLMASYPDVRQGRAYWSISPALGPSRKTPSGIPIGFDDDTAYLGVAECWAMKRLLAVPPELAKVSDLEEFRYQTLLHLLAADDLVLISIWSPTFLTALLSQLDSGAERLCADLHAALATNKTGRQERADEVAVILSANQSPTWKLRRIWPRLALISCWADGASARYAKELQQLFRHVAIQPKGLLATEAFVSFPLAGRKGAVLALRSHFFEFLDAHGEMKLAHQLEEGGYYQVVVTTGGGLYRYRLGDMVEVVGFENQCPLLRFVGRADRVSDLVGEKLDEMHVRAVLDQVFARHGVAPSFSMLVPVDNGVRRYRLYLQGIVLTAGQIRHLTEEIETGFDGNPYYRYAVRIGQLSRLQVRVLPPSAASAWSLYERECLTRGQKLGDIKPTVMHNWPGWAERFEALTPSVAPK